MYVKRTKYHKCGMPNALYVLFRDSGNSRNFAIVKTTQSADIAPRASRPACAAARHPVPTDRTYINTTCARAAPRWLVRKLIKKKGNKT